MIWINEPSRVFVARGGIAELTPTILTADEVRDLVERMLKSRGRRVDLSSPFVDATLADGSRLHVVIPDISRSHWQVNVRKFVVKADHLDDLVRLGTMPRQAATFLEAAVASGLNVLVAGGTQAGNPTTHETPVCQDAPIWWHYLAKGTKMDWIFDGIGTLIVGLLIGGGAGGAVGWRMAIKSTRQTQRAGDIAQQTQIGRDQINGRRD